MAYRFNGTSNWMEFAIGPFSGYTLGAWTVAVFVNSALSGGPTSFVDITDSGVSAFRMNFKQTTAALALVTTGVSSGPNASASTWDILAITKPGGAGAQPRFHMNSGSGWTHSNGSGTVNDLNIVSSDRLAVGGLVGGAQFTGGDFVCVGIKKSDTTDLGIAALSLTSFSAWTAFGFDWLIGFDASSTRNNQGGGTGGNEISRSGTSLVADPPGWAWSGGGAAVNSGFFAFA